MPWNRRELGELVSIVGGGTPSKERPEYWGGGIPWVSPKDMTSDTIAETEDSITKLGVEESATRLVPSGAVLMVVRSGILARRVPVALAGTNVTLNQDMKALVPLDHELRAEFLWYFLLARQPQLLAECVKRGATVQSIDVTRLERLMVPLPSPREQGRICELLGQANTLRRLRRESAEFVDRIPSALYRNVVAAASRSAAGVERVRLGEVCDFTVGGTLPAGTPYDGQRGGALLLKVSDLNAVGNELYIRRSAEWIDSTARSGAIAPTGAVVMPKRGGAIATNKKRLLRRPAILDPNLIAAYPKSARLNRMYLYQWFQEMDLRTISSGSSVPQLNKQDLVPLELPLLPDGLRRCFSRRLTRAFHLAEHSRRATQDLDHLFQVLLHHAFSGQLTACWRQAHMAEIQQEMEHQFRSLGEDTRRTADSVAAHLVNPLTRKGT